MNRMFGLWSEPEIVFAGDCSFGSSDVEIGLRAVIFVRATGGDDEDETVLTVTGSERLAELPPTRRRYFPSGSTR